MKTFEKEQGDGCAIIPLIGLFIFVVWLMTK
jgi:hypothetical protein